MVIRETEEVIPDYYGVQASLKLWSRDFERLIEYVEPVDAHEAVYSHRIFELLLRAATEFESLAKTYAHHAKIQFPNAKIQLATKPTIVDYHAVLQSLNLHQCRVGLLQWRPKTKWVIPFSAWGSGPPLDWYSAYNAAKHSRRADFSEATLLNAITAFSGVFATLIVGFGSYLWPAKTGQESRRVIGLVGDLPSDNVLHFHDFPFVVYSPPKP